MGPNITRNQSHGLFREPLNNLPFDGDTVTVFDLDNNVVAYVFALDGDAANEVVRGDAAVARAVRIAACVNYCKGIPTEDILAGLCFFQPAAPDESPEKAPSAGLSSHLLHLRDHGTVAVDAPCEVCGGTGGRDKIRRYCRFHPGVAIGYTAKLLIADRLPCGCPFDAIDEITEGCADCNNTGKITARVTMTELALLLIGGNSRG